MIYFENIYMLFVYVLSLYVGLASLNTNMSVGCAYSNVCGGPAIVRLDALHLECSK